MTCFTVQIVRSLHDEAYQHWADYKQQEDNMDDKVSWHECSHDRCSEAARLQLAWHDLKWLAECRCASVKSIPLLYSAIQLLQQVWDDDDAFGKYKEDDATDLAKALFNGDMQ